MTEDELRELAGYGGAAEVSFAGQQWKIADDPLFALLRYALAGVKAEPDDASESFAALYRLLEGCLADFAGFSEAAFTAKSSLEDVQAAGRCVVEHCCARGYWPALRLLGVLASSLEEIDGTLLRMTGRGLSTLTAREACNLALATCLEGRDEEAREEFFIDLNYEGSPEAEALAALKEYREQQRKMEAPVMGSGDG